MPARPRAPKTARDRGWARLFGFALVLGVACLAYEPPPLEKAWIDAEYPAAPVAASGVPPSPLLYRTGDLAVRQPRRWPSRS